MIKQNENCLIKGGDVPDQILKVIKIYNAMTSVKEYEFFSLCSGQLWMLLQLDVGSIIMKRVRANAFRGNLRPVLGKLVSLTFEKKNNDPLYIIQCSY